MTNGRPPEIFDRKLVRRRRARAARTFSDHSFLHDRAMEDVVDRLETVNRDFPDALLFGAAGLEQKLTDRCGVERVYHADIARERLPVAKRSLVYDEELTPFKLASFNLIVSILTLHTANDLVGALAQARMTLKPDGLFIAAIFAEETLSALRSALYAAESEVKGGVSARISPFASVQDFGQALQRAGFALPVVDLDRVRVSYAEPTRLLGDLRGMGETSALKRKAAPLTRGVLGVAIDKLGACEDERFDIAYLTAWAPHESQQKPLAPGSAKMSMEKSVKGDL